MNKTKKWLLAVSIATMFAANGVVMAATTAEQQGAPDGARPASMGKGHFAHKGGMRHFKGDNTALLELLKIDAATFKSEIQAGKSLVAIAREHGVSEQALKDFLVNQMSQRLDEAVKTGRIDAAKAEKMKAGIEERVADMINDKGPRHAGRAPMRGHGIFGDAKLLALLKIDAATLKNELGAGKTLVAIAQERGVSEQALKDFMVGEMTKRIEEGVKAGRISADKAEAMKVNIESRVSAMINGKGPKPGHNWGAH